MYSISVYETIISTSFYSRIIRDLLLGLPNQKNNNSIFVYEIYLKNKYAGF